MTPDEKTIPQGPFKFTGTHSGSAASEPGPAPNQARPKLTVDRSSELRLVGSPVAANRLLSLDAFRGLVIIVMFLVNVGGTDPAMPAWFPHRGWANGEMGNGLADLVFPCFLFIVGVSVPFSMAGGRGRSLTVGRRVTAAFIRGLKIYLLGTLVWCATIAYTSPIDLSVFKHWDILPLIGFAYFTCVLLSLAPRWVQALFVAAVLIFKWAILTAVPLPAEGKVVWTQTASYQSYINSSLGWWGVLITQGLAAAATAQLGSLAGGRLLTGSTTGLRREQCKHLLIVGAVTLTASYVWHRFGGLPYSKDFFTSSYILCAAGVSGLVLGLMMYVIDIRNITTMRFLRVLGTNALAMYILAELLWKCAMMKWKMVTPGGGESILVASLKAWAQHALGSPELGTWLFVICYIMFYWLIAAALYKRGWFIKV